MNNTQCNTMPLLFQPQRSNSSTELIMSNYLIAVTLISQIVAFAFFRKKNQTSYFLINFLITFDDIRTHSCPPPPYGNYKVSSNHKSFDVKLIRIIKTGSEHVICICFNVLMCRESQHTLILSFQRRFLTQINNKYLSYTWNLLIREYRSAFSPIS